MNIFKVLSSNDGSINEPNVSSFLAYLLDPNENPGLGSRFVERFLSPMILRNEEHYKELLYNNRVRDLSNEKSDYGKPVIQYIKDFYDAVDIGTDIEHEELKRWVKDKIQAASGLIIKNANFDNSYIVNDRNRRHYGVNSPFKMEKNLFYYPEEANKKLIRKLDITNPPAGVMIYWKDSESPDGVGRALLTDVWKDQQI
ncbi:PD-(D/E)XK nuclease family protein [Aneurinibacillus sp. REN35]|uniref:PD-(D/E)XK nuclease family protein n=1 Tax=Aneurinibacillus sp. REN35 TaxID=3237286 RepID=UPI003528AA9A